MVHVSYWANQDQWWAWMPYRYALERRHEAEMKRLEAEAVYAMHLRECLYWQWWLDNWQRDGWKLNVSLQRKEKRGRQRQFEKEWLESWFSRSAMLQWERGGDWTVDKFLFDRWQ